MRLRIALAGFVGLLVAAQGSLAQPLTVPEDGAFDNLGVNPNLVSRSAPGEGCATAASGANGQAKKGCGAGPLAVAARGAS